MEINSWCDDLNESNPHGPIGCGPIRYGLVG